MVIKAQFEIPKSWTKAKKAAAAAYEILPGKPDIDNIAKIVLDSFNGVVFEDDAQVYDLKVVKDLWRSMFVDRGHLLEVVTETPLQFLARAIGLGYTERTNNNAGSEYRSILPK